MKAMKMTSSTNYSESEHRKSQRDAGFFVSRYRASVAQDETVQDEPLLGGARLHHAIAQRATSQDQSIQVA